MQAVAAAAAVTRNNQTVPNSLLRHGAAVAVAGSAARLLAAVSVI